MNYKKNYYDYIEYLKNLGKRNLEYSEKHHIIPKSLGGLNCKENLVKFTGRQHYVAHELLVMH